MARVCCRTVTSVTHGLGYTYMTSPFWLLWVPGPPSAQECISPFCLSVCLTVCLELMLGPCECFTGPYFHSWISQPLFPLLSNPCTRAERQEGHLVQIFGYSVTPTKGSQIAGIASCKPAVRDTSLRLRPFDVSEGLRLLWYLPPSHWWQPHLASLDS